MKIKNLFSLVICLAVTVSAGAAGVSTFDDLSLAVESHWGGAGSGETGFTNGNVYFPHNDSSYSWDGFAYSNETDTTTAGYTSQFSAYTGSGAEGSANYAVSWCAIDWGSPTYDIIPNTASLMSESVVSGGYFTNTTYTVGSMLNGDMFAKKFGGTSGDDADWLKMTIWGVDSTGGYTTANPVEFYLADYRFADNSQDYIVDEWTWVDLSGLGEVIGLEFCLDSTDVGAYGMNTPAYFAMDSLTIVPEPITIALLGLGGFFIRKRKNK